MQPSAALSGRAENAADTSLGDVSRDVVATDLEKRHDFALSCGNLQDLCTGDWYNYTCDRNGKLQRRSRSPPCEGSCKCLQLASVADDPPLKSYFITSFGLEPLCGPVIKSDEFEAENTSESSENVTSSAATTTASLDTRQTVVFPINTIVTYYFAAGSVTTSYPMIGSLSDDGCQSCQAPNTGLGPCEDTILITSSYGPCLFYGIEDLIFSIPDGGGSVNIGTPQPIYGVICGYSDFPNTISRATTTDSVAISTGLVATSTTNALNPRQTELGEYACVTFWGNGFYDSTIALAMDGTVYDFCIGNRGWAGSDCGFYDWIESTAGPCMFYHMNGLVSEILADTGGRVEIEPVDIIVKSVCRYVGLKEKRDTELVLATSKEDKRGYQSSTHVIYGFEGSTVTPLEYTTDGIVHMDCITIGQGCAIIDFIYSSAGPCLFYHADGLISIIYDDEGGSVNVTPPDQILKVTCGYLGLREKRASLLKVKNEDDSAQSVQSVQSVQSDESVTCVVYTDLALVVRNSLDARSDSLATSEPVDSSLIQSLAKRVNYAIVSVCKNKMQDKQRKCMTWPAVYHWDEYGQVELFQGVSNFECETICYYEAIGIGLRNVSLG